MLKELFNMFSLPLTIAANSSGYGGDLIISD